MAGEAVVAAGVAVAARAGEVAAVEAVLGGCGKQVFAGDKLTPVSGKARLHYARPRSLVAHRGTTLLDDMSDEPES